MRKLAVVIMRSCKANQRRQVTTRFQVYDARASTPVWYCQRFRIMGWRIILPLLTSDFIVTQKRFQ